MMLTIMSKWTRFCLRSLKVIIVFLLVNSIAIAGFAGKHPRALQLERQLTEGLESQLRNLLGSEPFLVNIQIEPLTVQKDQLSKTQLPFVGALEEEVVDLWNDPDVPDYMLLSRVNRITANIVVPQEVPDHWIEDIKSLARKQWPYYEGRDFIQVEKKNLKWYAQKGEEKSSLISGVHKGVWGILGAILAYALVHLLGTVLASRKLASAIRQVKFDTSALASLPTQGFSSSFKERSKNAEDGGGLKGDTRISGGELQLHDTIKISELILTWVSELERVKNFPTLEDMKILEEELAQSPGSVGALVNAFPEELKNAVFAYSKSDKWFEALLKPSLLDAKSFALMSRLMRVNRSLRPEGEEKVLLHAWYAEDKLGEFLKALEPDDVVWILAHLPKSLALAFGREVLPGRWAILLDHQKLSRLSRKPSGVQLQAYLKKLCQLKALRTPELLSLFKQERDLMSYLNVVHPQVEKEIYLAAGEGSGIHVLRPPFYPLFDLDEQVMKEFCALVPLEILSRSLFNLSKDYRVKVEKVLSDKQKFVLLDHLRRMDKKGLSPEFVGEARTEVGRYLRDFLKEHATFAASSQPDLQSQAA